jgi:hypothetical protein
MELCGPDLLSDAPRLAVEVPVVSRPGWSWPCRAAQMASRHCRRLTVEATAPFDPPQLQDNTRLAVEASEAAPCR